MLNYTSKIQHFLNLHRKHTKYIVVLLLLSAFVASFVCSALTEPAVSMTDPIQMGQNVTLLADGDQSDGLPILGYHYADDNSQFKEYIYWNADWNTSEIRQEHLLGSAHNFGMFAFDTINVGSSCNSNLAAPNLELGHTFGLGSIADNGGQEITVATNSVKLNSSLTSRNTVLLFPENVKFIDEQGKPVNINPLPRVQIGGNHLEKGNSAVYAYHVTSNFIKFGEEQGKFKQLQQKLINETSGTVSIQNYQDNKIEKVTVSTEGINYLTIPYTDLPDGSRAINFEIENNAALIINVDLKDAPSDYKTGFQVNGKVNGLDFQKDDKASINGVNILWNFYDSSQTEKQYSGSITFDNPGYGCILAPSATVTLSATYAGNIVANNINAGATVNKAMFMTGVEAKSSFIALMAAKEWNDGNENHSSDYVTFQLYKSSVANANVNDLTETVGAPVEVKATDNWNCTWFNLDQSYYYYVKEVASGTIGGNPFICDTEYTNNGGNKTGTITVKNKKVDSSNIDTSAKLDLTIKLYWSDDAKAHETYEDVSDNTEYKRKWVNIYRTTDPSQIGTMNDAHKVEEDHISDSGVFVTERADKNGEDGQAWQRVIKNLPVTDSNKNIYYYYAQIVNGSDKYYFNYSNNNISRNNGTITVACIKKLTITVKKSWNWGTQDPENVSSVRYELYRSMKDQQTIPSDAVKITEFDTKIESSNGWTQSIYPLPQSDVNCNMYYYYIKETHVNDNESELSKYNVSYAYNDELYSYPFNDHGEMTITNERKQAGNVSIKVAKRMTVLHGTSKAKLQYSNDGDNWSDYYVDGKQVIQTLSEDNNWQCTFINLPKYENNDSTKPRSYRVLEEDTPPGFNVSYSGNDVLAYDSADNTIHNVYINNNEKLVTINVKKIWNNISPDLIKHVIVKVYRYKGDINAQAYNISYLQSASNLTLNSYINMLNDSLTPKLNDKTATYSDVHYKNNNNYSSQNYNAWVNLSQFSGKTINEIKIKFSSGCGSDQNFLNNTTHFACDKFDNLRKISQSNPSPFYQTGNSVQNSYSSNWSTTSTTIVFNGLNVQLSDNYHFVIATANDYTTDNTKYIEEIIFTFNETVEGNNGGSTGSGTGGTTDDEDDTEQDDETTIETSGNTVTYRNLPFVNMGYSNHPWNVYIDLRDYSSRTLVSATVTLTDSARSNAMLLFGTLGSDNKMSEPVVRYGNFNQNSTATISNINVQVDTNCLVITAGEDSNQPSYRVESVVLTFEDTGGNVITSGDTITVTPNKDTNGNYSPDGTPYNYYYQFNLAEHIGKQITKIEVDFTGNLADKHLFISTNPKDLQNTAPMVYKKIANDSNQGMTILGNNFTYSVKDEQEHYQEGLRVIQNGDILVVAGESEDFTVNSFKITFAIHNQKNYPFSSGYVKEHTNIDDNNFHSKEVDYVELHFKSNSTEFAKWENYDFWLGDYGSRNAGTTGISQNNNVVKWDYDAVTSVYKIGARFIDSTNVEKIKIVYEDCSTYTINNTFSNSSAIHQSKDVTIKSGEQQYIDIDGSFHSKAVACLELYFKSNSEDFKNDSKYDFWLGDYNSTNATTDEVIGIFERNPYYIVKRTYNTNPTNVNKIGVNFEDSNNVHSIKIYYTDGSTYTINNTKDNEDSPTYIEREFEHYFNNDTNCNISYYNNESYYDLFKEMQLQSAKIYYANSTTFEQDATNFVNKIFDVEVKSNWNKISHSNLWWDNGDLVKQYSNQTYITNINLNPANNKQNFEKIELYFNNGKLTIKNANYDSNNLATGSGNTETLEHSETINVLSTNLNADGNLDYSKSLAWQIPDQFRGFTVKEIKAEFHNRNILTREGTEYYNTVFNMNIYAINDKQLYENWDIGDLGDDYKSKFDDEKHLIYKRYLPKNYNNEEKYSYSELDFLLICTAYTENLKEIVITFEGGHTITLTNGNAGTNIEEPLPYNPYDITLVETITLTAGDNWEHILSNQPMVAPDGSPYYYVIEEIEIEYKDGTKLSSAISISNLFEVESTVLNALDLEENPNNNNLTVTNKLKTTNTTMPSTGGIGTHPYRNAGILMMICSGGIYISLRALRKKQN